MCSRKQIIKNDQNAILFIYFHFIAYNLIIYLKLKGHFTALDPFNI